MRIKITMKHNFMCTSEDYISFSDDFPQQHCISKYEGEYFSSELGWNGCLKNICFKNVVIRQKDFDGAGVYETG